MHSSIACFENLIATSCLKDYDNSDDWQIDGPRQFLIPSISLTFDKMMQEPDNFENFVKIQIFLQFTLRGVKVVIVFYTGKKSPLR